VWRKQFAEVAHTFQPGSETRRVRGAAPPPRPTPSDGDVLGEGGEQQQQSQSQKSKKEWPLDGRLSTRGGAYNDGVPWWGLYKSNPVVTHRA
jgi:hypothetical protein